jgi:hypothetical protein
MSARGGSSRVPSPGGRRPLDKKLGTMPFSPGVYISRLIWIAKWRRGQRDLRGMADPPRPMAPALMIMACSSQGRMRSVCGPAREGK